MLSPSERNWRNNRPACETPYDQPLSWAKVSGLWSATIHAGAGCLILSLWRADEPTRQELVQALYRHLQQGRRPAEALAVRLQTYHDKTDPILELFRRKEYVITVDTRPPQEMVQAEIRQQLGLPPQKTPDPQDPAPGAPGTGSA